MTRTYFCTRPTLVNLLMEAGKECEQCNNPFRPSNMAWRIPIDADVIRIVTDYYTAMGKPIPAPIAEAAKECDRA